MKKLSNAILLLSTTLLFYACQKPDEAIDQKAGARKEANITKVQILVDATVNGEYEVRNGIFYFKDFTTFASLDRKLRDLVPEKRIQFTSQLGFTSLLDLQLQAYKQLGEAQTKEHFNQVLSENKNILTGNGEQLSSVFDEVSSALLNGEGIVSIGGVVHCFHKEKTIIGFDLEKVRQATKTGSASDKSVTINPVSKNAPGARVAASCANFDQTNYANNNREVRVQVTNNHRDFAVSNTNGIWMYNREYYSYVVGVPRKTNFFGSWVNYSSANSLYSRFTATVFLPFQWWQFPGYPQSGGITPDDTRSNEAELIDFSPTILTVGPFTEYYRTSGDFTPSFTLSEGSPLGLYTSAGVPSGVQMKCN